MTIFIILYFLCSYCTSQSCVAINMQLSFVQSYIIFTVCDALYKWFRRNNKKHNYLPLQRNVIVVVLRHTAAVHITIYSWQMRKEYSLHAWCVCIYMSNNMSLNIHSYNCVSNISAAALNFHIIFDESRSHLTRYLSGHDRDCLNSWKCTTASYHSSAVR